MLDYERYCGEIGAQTELLAHLLPGRDMATPVPSCPGWTVGQAVRHLGHGHRWVTDVVRTRSSRPLPDTAMRELSGYTDEDPAELVRWLTEGAEELGDILREAGPDTEVWTPIPGGRRSPEFFARRFTHETVIHRADVALALGEHFAPAHDVAVDAIDEWLDLAVVTWPLQHVEEHRALQGPGRTLHFHATDTHAEWVVDLTGDGLTWRREHEKCAVAVRGSLTELLLVIYRRRSLGDAAVEIFGDTEFLTAWLDVVGFG